MLLVCQLVVNRMMEQGVFGRTEAFDIVLFATFWFVGMIVFGTLTVNAALRKPMKKSVCSHVVSTSLCISGLIAMYIVFESYLYVA